MFDRTNAQTRFLAKASVRLADDFDPELLVYAAGGDTMFGLNVTRVFGKSVVGYLEWSGGERASLVHNALAYGIATGSLPSSAANVLSQTAVRGFRNDLSIGASYATEDELSFNLEYHFHEAGFSDRDWRNWFATGIGANDATRGALWYIRGYASDRQEPVARSSMFFRADWEDAIVHDLSLTGFVQADTRDGSGIAQLSADYSVSDSWSVGGLVDVTFGGRRSDLGSIPQASSVLVRVSRYF